MLPTLLPLTFTTLYYLYSFKMDRWNADFDRETTLDEFILEERPDEPPDEPPDDPEPLSNPPQDHRLFTDLYDSLEDLIDELRDRAASAGFGICKQRSNNYIRGFGPTRIRLPLRLRQLHVVGG